MVKKIDTYSANPINLENSKKLQEVLWKEETQKLYKSNYEKYKKLEEKIHILSSTQTELLDLKKDLTLEEKADKLLRIIEEKENSTEYKVEKEIKNNKEKVKKELRKKATDSVPIIWWFLFDFVSKINTKNDNSFFWKILKYLKSSILSWLWIENLEEQLEKVKLNKEQIKETKDKITQYLVTNLKLSWKEEDIKKILNNPDIFTPEKLVKYYKNIQSWDWFSSNDLIKDFWNVWNIKETIKEGLKNLDKKAFDKISKYIFKEYDEKRLDEWASQDLKILIKKYITDWSLSDEVLSKILNKKEFQMKELYPLLWNGLMFSLELVWKWIISTSDMLWNFASESTKLVQIWIPWLWFSWSISTDLLYEKLNSMWDNERAALIWLLYRKWGLFFNAIWSLSAGVTRIWLDIVLPSNTWVDWVKLFIDWIFKWPEQQFKNISQLEKAIIWVWSNKDSIKGIQNLKKNYQVMAMLNSSKTPNDFKKYLKWENLTLLKEYLDIGTIKAIQDWNIKSMKEISKVASSSIKTAFVQDFGADWAKEKWVWFGKSAATQKLNRAINNAAKWQKEILEKWIWITRYSKFREAFAASKISHLSDKLVFEFETKKWAKTFLKQMNVMAQASPELIKWIFNKLPIISVLWFSVTSDKPFLEEIQNEMLYLIPIVWPVLLFGESWASFKDGFDIKNPEKAILWSVLFWLDWFIIWKNIATWEFLKAWKYMVKPLTDIYDIWKGTAEFIQKTYKVTSTAKSFTGVYKEVAKKTKHLKWKLRLLAIVFLLGSSLAYANSEQWLDEYKNEEWGLDTNKLRKEIKNMNKEEKEEFIKLFFSDKVNNYTEMSIKWNILEIVSKDKALKWDWFINDETRNKLDSLFWISKIDFKYKKTHLSKYMGTVPVSMVS